MAELRRNPVKNVWTVISPERGRLPFVSEDKAKGEESCPFCQPHKKDGFYKIYSIYDNDGKELLYVTPNKYPVLGVEGNLERSPVGICDTITGIGANEIIVDSMRHGISAGSYTEDELYRLFTAFKVRMEDLVKDIRFRYIAGFKSIGVDAGDYIGHPYAQITALPVIPPKILTQIEESNKYYLEKERCIFCDLIEQGALNGRRIVFENYDFIGFCPFASEYPFQVHIYPKKHGHSFTELAENNIRQLAEVVKEVYSRMGSLLRSPSILTAIHTAPPKAGRKDVKNMFANIENSFHWHIEIRPVLIKSPGFEWATGMNINPIQPEEAALLLREVVIK